MKSTTVPAQVTTVEDKIAGNLNLSQLLLLAASVFVGFALYIVIPPNMKFSIAKIVLCLLVMLVFASLSIKVKGKILALWVGTLLRYNLRPRYYVFNKNDLFLRGAPNHTVNEQHQALEEAPTPVITKTPFAVPLPQVIQLESAVADPRAQLAFETNKKGGLHVRITEIKQES